MANLMHRFLRNQFCLRAIPRLTPSLINLRKSSISNVESLSVEFDPVPLANPVITVSGIKSNEAQRFYPCFPLGYGFTPNVIHDLGVIDTVPFADAVVDEKVTAIYADSVKKKRKKKMNKHKYRKLRKRLGRKS